MKLLDLRGPAPAEWSMLSSLCTESKFLLKSVLWPNQEFSSTMWFSSVVEKKALFSLFSRTTPSFSKRNKISKQNWAISYIHKYNALRYLLMPTCTMLSTTEPNLNAASKVEFNAYLSGNNSLLWKEAMTMLKFFGCFWNLALIRERFIRNVFWIGLIISIMLLCITPGPRAI